MGVIPYQNFMFGKKKRKSLHMKKKHNQNIHDIKHFKISVGRWQCLHSELSFTNSCTVNHETKCVLQNCYLYNI